MKSRFTPISYVFVFVLLTGQSILLAQNVGIGTLVPDHKLHVSSNTSNLLNLNNTTGLGAGVMSELYFKSGQHFTGAIKTIGNGPFTARLGLFTYAATSSSSLIERISIMDNGHVGVGTNDPGYLLDVNGRMRVRHGNGTAGILFMDDENLQNRGFVGMSDDNTIGFYGFGGGGWGLTMNTNSGTVSIASHLYVTNNNSTAAYFNNYSGSQDGQGVHGKATTIASMGVGVEGEGGGTGVLGNAVVTGAGNRYGVEAYGRHGSGNNYGVYATAFSGNNAYGIYASATGGTTNWGGYFSGSVYTTGNYQSSDRKLKSDIRPLENAISLVRKLKPSSYQYRTDEFRQMALPSGPQYGLVADEVKQVFPSMVKQAVQPVQYENDDRTGGRIVAEEVTFEAVNYTAMIPVLIAAIQEQQLLIEAQQKQIESLEAKLK